MATPQHPMVPFLVDLEREYDPTEHRDYDPIELVRFALGASDCWADLAVRWLEEGLPAPALMNELAVLEAESPRPQALRHRARRFRKSSE